MQNTKGNQSRNQPQQDNQSKVGRQCHEGSAKVRGEALHVNENDVRDQPQLDNQSTNEQQCHDGSANGVKGGSKGSHCCGENGSQ
jgi:hypothetical protein